MPTFIYTATNSQGKILSGEIETVDIKAAKKYLNRQELMAISIKLKNNSFNRFTNLFSAHINEQDKIMITKHLSTMINSGLSLKEGIKTILNDTKKKPLKKILTEIKFDLEKGQPLSTTFKKYPNSFSNIFIAITEAGEASGTLEKSLKYLGIQIKKDYNLKQKLKGAMIYPTVLIIASILIIILMMVFVVPKLAQSFIQNKLELPWTTQFIINISDFISTNIFLIITLLIIFSFSFFYLRKKEKFQNIISEIIFKIPIISDLYIKIILARFTRTLGTLLASGISILKALDISTETLGHNRYRKAINKINDEVSRGIPINNALKERKDIFPFMLINMISVGEKTGNLESTLKELAIFYEEEVDNGLKNMISLIEPIILIVMGIVVATIAFSIIMPIYQLVGSVN